MMRSLFLILLIIFSGKVSAQREWYFAARHTAITPMLDQVQASAAAAFSMRKLRNEYTGAAIRVRRSSDNAEQNIGFDASGNLNAAQLTSFVGSSSAFITTWYDQSGNFFDISQATAANQPRIVDAGTIDLLNSKPSPRGDDTDFLLGSDPMGANANEVEVFLVTRLYDITSGAGGAYFFFTWGFAKVFSQFTMDKHGYFL